MKHTKYHFDHYEDTKVDFELIEKLTAASVPERIKYRLKEFHGSEETLEKAYGCKIDCFSIGTKITILSGDWCYMFTFFLDTNDLAYKRLTTLEIHELNDFIFDSKKKRSKQ